MATVTAHGKLTVSWRWVHGELSVTTASRDWAVTWAMIELWPSRDWAVIAVAVTEQWSSGSGAVTTVVTVSSPWAHGGQFFSHGKSALVHAFIWSNADPSSLTHVCGTGGGWGWWGVGVEDGGGGWGGWEALGDIWYYWFIAEVSRVKLPSEECLWTLLIISQHWFG